MNHSQWEGLQCDYCEGIYPPSKMWKAAECEGCHQKTITPKSALSTESEPQETDGWVLSTLPNATVWKRVWSRRPVTIFESLLGNWYGSSDGIRMFGWDSPIKSWAELKQQTGI